MRVLGAVVCSALVASSAHAHDINLSLAGNLTSSSTANPRLGGVSVSLNGTFDATDRLSLFGGVSWTADLPTTSADSEARLVSSGGSIALFSAGLMVMLGEHVLLTASGVGSPQTNQVNSTYLQNVNGVEIPAQLVARSTFASGTVMGSWGSFGESNFEHTVDLSASLSWWKTLQRLNPAPTAAGTALITQCNDEPKPEGCELVGNVAEAQLFQGRIAGGYTATLFQRLDVGVEGALYLYDQPNPAEVGLYGVLTLGRDASIGSGVPVNPLAGQVRPSLRLSLGRVTLGLAWQVGVYVDELGVNHLLALRVGLKLTRAWRLSLSVVGQGDAWRAEPLNNLGASASLGVTFVY